MKKSIALGLALACFYFVGIVANSIIVEMIWKTDMTQTPIWSGAGFTFAIIAFFTYPLCKRVYEIANK